MRVTNIKTKVARLKARIAKLNIELKLQQDLCKHPNAVKVAKSDTGNYSKSDDAYWHECKCPDCDKYWTEEQ
jgi:hypothetical protein